jgi:hypothetical protein
MELTHLNQIDFDELQLEKIDCMFSTAENQPRCIFLAENLSSRVFKKILLNPENSGQKPASKYISQFVKLGFIQQEGPLNDPESMDRLLSGICNVKSRQINIAVDYSCMPKKMYAMFIDCITRNVFQADRINLFLSYTPKVFERSPGKQAMDYFGPMLFNRDKLKNKKPISLIVSLDHNSGSVYEAVNKVKPHKILAFIPHCSHDPGYSDIVCEQNRLLLAKLDVQNIISYECNQPDEINSLLTSICLDERVNSEVVIVPQGPKTFSMVSMLLSVRYPDIKLWEIIFKDHKINPDHGNAAAIPVIVKVSFINDELD